MPKDKPTKRKCASKLATRAATRKGNGPSMMVPVTVPMQPAKVTSRCRNTSVAHEQSITPADDVSMVNVQELQAKIAELTNNLAAMEKKLEKKKKKKDEMIAEPAKRKSKDEGGLCGDMGLYNMPEGRILYGEILHELHDACKFAHIDFSRTFKQQALANVSMVYKLLREKFEVLCQHQHDWAASKLLQQYINNKCKYKTRRNKKEADILATSNLAAANTSAMGSSASANQRASITTLDIDNLIPMEEEDEQLEPAGDDGGVESNHDEGESEGGESTFDSDD
ncbi:hypothetical protein EWM64_g8221 [Hericium alpestre]|uniref:Uncharacterized protein n=1 Tax=Hericium alpestre TaxID=135208 RepID=A0A4Y9ZLY9_9AGAM|nr:hypothetical protein EWM64_g8221 [Hericium alpestre]